MEPLTPPPQEEKTGVKESSESQPTPALPPCKEVFIGGLPKKFRLEILENYLRGELSSDFRLVMGGEKSKKKKFRGYVVLKGITEEEAARLLERKEREIGDIRIFLKPFFTGEHLKLYKKSQKPRKIWVKGLSPSWTTPRLRKFLTNFGPLEDVCAITEPEKNLCRGYGYAVFSEERTAKECSALGELWVEGERVWVTKYEDRYKFPQGVQIEILGARRKSLQGNRRKEKKKKKKHQINEQLLSPPRRTFPEDIWTPHHGIHSSPPNRIAPDSGWRPYREEPLSPPRRAIYEGTWTPYQEIHISPPSRTKPGGRVTAYQELYQLNNLYTYSPVPTSRNSSFPMSWLVSMDQYASFGWATESEGYRLNLNALDAQDRRRMYLPVGNKLYLISRARNPNQESRGRRFTENRGKPGIKTANRQIW